MLCEKCRCEIRDRDEYGTVGFVRDRVMRHMGVPVYGANGRTVRNPRFDRKVVLCTSCMEDAEDILNRWMGKETPE